MSRLTRNAVSLAYEESGTGDPAMLLVHSWAGDRSYFAPQISHFSRAHRVVAVDLRGHGESDKPHGTYSPNVFVEDVAWICDQLDVRHSVLIGHSMGGIVVLELAARQPELAAAVILLDAPVFPPPDLVEAMRAVAPEFRGPDYAAAARQFVEGVFLATDDPVRRAEILEKTVRCPQHVLSSVWEQSILNYDASNASAACQVPVCYIGAATPLADLSRFRALCPQLVVGQTVGAGHFHELEVPDQINAMIERFLLTALARTGTTT